MTSHVVPDQFIDLVCADPLLLGAEFDDIIASEFPERKEPADRRHTGEERSPRGRRTPDVAPTGSDSPRRPVRWGYTPRTWGRAPPCP